MTFKSSLRGLSKANNEAICSDSEIPSLRSPVRLSRQGMMFKSSLREMSAAKDEAI